MITGNHSEVVLTTQSVVTITLRKDVGHVITAGDELHARTRVRIELCQRFFSYVGMRSFGVMTPLCDRPTIGVVIRDVQHFTLDSTRRSRAHTAGSGLLEVLTGPEPSPLSKSRSVRRSINVLAAIGALLIVLAFLILVLALNRIEAPGFGLLHINARVAKHGVTANGQFRFKQLVVTGIQSLKSIQILVGCGALLLAIRSSMTMWRFVFVSALVGPLLPRIGWGPMLPLRTGSEFLQLVLLVAIFCIAGLRHSRAALWWMWAFSFAPIWFWYQPSWEVAVAATVVLTAVTVAIDALGASQRLRMAQVARIELEEARRTVLEERTRIARELHDVVAHHMSLIAVQAETAPYRIKDLSDSALQEFNTVSSQAREALTDMRRLLGVLRDDEQSERAPQPQLADVPQLVAVTRRVGVHVDLSMSEHQGQVPSGVGLCAFRIVQEALSNACRHAPGSSVSVSVEDDANALRLQVRNGPGSSHSTTVSRRAGHGLAGMRERVAMLGGSLSTQAAPDGGYSVLAVLPFEPLVPTRSP